MQFEKFQVVKLTGGYFKGGFAVVLNCSHLKRCVVRLLDFSEGYGELKLSADYFEAVSVGNIPAKYREPKFSLLKTLTAAVFGAEVSVHQTNDKAASPRALVVDIYDKLNGKKEFVETEFEPEDLSVSEWLVLIESKRLHVIVSTLSPAAEIVREYREVLNLNGLSRAIYAQDSALKKCLEGTRKLTDDANDNLTLLLRRLATQINAVL